MIVRLKEWWNAVRHQRIQTMGPWTLDEAVDRMAASMTENEKRQYVRENPECPGTRWHFTSGMHIRNEWSLWGEESELARWFTAHGIHHGDDRSACLFKALYCRLRGEPFDIAAEAAYYKAFWAKMEKVQSGASFGVRCLKNGRVEIDL